MRTGPFLETCFAFRAAIESASSKPETSDIRKKMRRLETTWQSRHFKTSNPCANRQTATAHAVSEPTSAIRSSVNFNGITIAARETILLPCYEQHRIEDEQRRFPNCLRAERADSAHEACTSNHIALLLAQERHAASITKTATNAAIFKAMTFHSPISIVARFWRWYTVCEYPLMSAGGLDLR